MSRKDKHHRSGSAKVRRARKWWLLETFGDGESCLCANGCGTVLFFESVTVDRWPIPGVFGGTYARNNIRPTCLACNTSLGADMARKRLGQMSYEEAKDLGYV